MCTSQRICTRCVYDTTISEIVFDGDGVCQFCRIHDEMEKLYPQGEAARTRLADLTGRIKAAGRGRPYDCVVGVSGGVDSIYTLLMAKRLGLRPLAVHFDNGWNTETAVSNIEKATSVLDVDLHTHVADWEKFKALQKAFLKASVSDAEIPTDMAIHAVLHETAAREGIRYLLIGHSFRTEGIVPKTWTYFEGTYIRSVHKAYGGGGGLGVPLLTLRKLAYYLGVRRLKTVPLLNYVPYDKRDAARELASELGWRDYGGHHHESLYTKFFQSHLLPFKFGIDKRKLGLSARIRSGRITRQDALEELAASPYPHDPEVVEYTMEKLGISMPEFEAIMAAPPLSFMNYRTLYPLMRRLKMPITLGFRLGVVPKILYYKYMY